MTEKCLQLKLSVSRLPSGGWQVSRCGHGWCQTKCVPLWRTANECPPEDSHLYWHCALHCDAPHDYVICCETQTWNDCVSTTSNDWTYNTQSISLYHCYYVLKNETNFNHSFKKHKVIFTLRSSCSAVYYNRSCLSLSVCGSITMITRNCVHRSSPN